MWCVHDVKLWLPMLLSKGRACVCELYYGRVYDIGCLIFTYTHMSVYT
jgi:hypothetical protein